MIECGAWPIELFPGVDKRWLCVCMACGDFRRITYSNVVTNRQRPCKTCTDRETAERLRHSQAHVVAFFRALNIRIVGEYVNNRTPIDCVCLTCGESIRPTYGNARRKGVGACGGACKRKKIGDSNRGDAAAAVHLALANDLEPIAAYMRHDDPWPCRCVRTGVIVTPTLGSIKQQGHCCSVCGAMRQGDARRLAPEVAEARVRAAGLEPIGSYPGRVDVPWPCRCACGTEIRPGLRVSEIREGDTRACHNCTSTSYKLDDPGWVYLLTHPQARFVKWGKSTVLEKRLAVHRYQGFDDVCRIWALSTGRLANLLEQQITTWVRGQGAVTTIEQRLMRYKGYTETASLDEISVAAIINFTDDLLAP
ncbi:hypothetical protein AB0F64_40640 [Streptomyces sp. NPDC026294]